MREIDGGNIVAHSFNMNQAEYFTSRLHFGPFGARITLGYFPASCCYGGSWQLLEQEGGGGIDIILLLRKIVKKIGVGNIHTFAGGDKIHSLDYFLLFATLVGFLCSQSHFFTQKNTKKDF